MSQSVTAADVRTAAAVAALMDRIDAASERERWCIRRDLEALVVRPGVKSGQAGRIRAALAHLGATR